MKPWEPICLVHLEVNNCQRSPGRNWAGRALRISQPHHQWWSMAKRRCRVGYYKLENSHGIWKSTVWKGKSLSSSKPPFLGSMLVWGGVDVLEFSRHFLGWICQCSECREDMQWHFERILPKMTLLRFTKATYGYISESLWFNQNLVLLCSHSCNLVPWLGTTACLGGGDTWCFSYQWCGAHHWPRAAWHTWTKTHGFVQRPRGNTLTLFRRVCHAQGFYSKILGHKILGFAPFKHLLDFWKEGDQSEWVEVVPTGGGPVFLWHDTATFVCCHQQSVWKDAECIGPGHVFVVWKMIILWQRGLVRRSDRWCCSQAWARQTGMSQHVNLLQLNAFTGVQVFLMCSLVIGSGVCECFFDESDHCQICFFVVGISGWQSPSRRCMPFLAQCVCR